MPLLDVRHLSIAFGAGEQPVVDDFSLVLEEGEVVGIAGESGCGKTVSMLAIMGLIGWPGRITAGLMRFAGQDLSALSPRKRRSLLGRDLAMVFQEPKSSLNPCFTIGFQITETLAAHTGLGRRERRSRAVELLQQVGIPAPESRLRSFPHQLSSGMNQRVMIAIALACRPRLLIADEPTTALDVTVQAQILDLLLERQRETGMALLLVTHDLAVIAGTAARVLVMYAGKVVEEGPTREVFASPRHPYTQASLDALPERHAGHARLAALPGSVPGLDERPQGCSFHPRCRFAAGVCRRESPALLPAGHGLVRCHLPLAGDGTRGP